MDEPFTMIPNRIIDNLQARGIAIYCYISRFNPTFYGGETMLSKKLGMHRTTTRKYLDALIKMGYLKKTVRKGQSSIYEVVQKVYKVVQKSDKSKGLPVQNKHRVPVHSETTNKTTINNIREKKEKTPQAVERPVVSKEEKGQQRFFPGKEVTNIFQELGMSTK